MTDVYVYVDETGDLDFSGNPRASTRFGLGSAVFRGPHGAALAAGLELRCSLEAEGLSLPRGFHAKDDSHRTRDEVFGLIREQSPRFDVTFLDKERAYPRVREVSVTYRYKLAVYLHLKWLIPRVAPVDGTVFVILGSLQTAGKREANPGVGVPSVGLKAPSGQKKTGYPVLTGRGPLDPLSPASTSICPDLRMCIGGKTLVEIALARRRPPLMPPPRSALPCPGSTPRLSLSCATNAPRSSAW